MLAYLIKYSTNKTKVFLLPFVVAIEAVSLILFTAQLVPIVNYISKGEFETSSAYIARYALFIFVYIIFKYIRQIMIDYIAVDNEKNVYENAINKIAQMQPREIYFLGKGTMVSLLSSELKQNKLFILSYLYELLYEPIVFVLTILYIFSINSLLACIMIPLMLATVLIAFFCSKKLAKIYSKKNTDIEEQLTTQREIFANISTLKLYGQDDYFCCLNQDISRKLCLDEEVYARNKAKNYFFSLVNEYMPTIVMIVVSIFLMKRVELNIGQFVAVMQLLASVSLPFSKYASTIVETRNTMTTIKKLENTLSMDTSRTDEMVELEEPQLFYNSPLILEDVSFKYDDKNILNHCTLKIHEGEHIGIFGKSGDGKTTLLNIILGFLPEYEGSVRLLGHEVKASKSELLWEKIAYASQDGFFLNANIPYNISAGATNTIDEKMKKIFDVTNLWEDINEKIAEGINTTLVDGGMNLSGGQRQKLAIARALYKPSDFLILDEPSDALDEKTEEAIFNYLSTLRDKTMLIVSHRMSTLAKCDRTYCLRDGRLYEESLHNRSPKEHK